MNKKDFKNCLYQMVKNDYGFEIYNNDENIIRFSFYHLNSVYNAFCTSVAINGEFGSPSINWQYAKENKRIAKYAEKIVAFMVEYKQKYGNIEWCEKEIEYYSQLSNAIYKAKYSTKIFLHTENL